MHPQIIEDKPGDCPICGMALEAINGSEAPHQETEHTHPSASSEYQQLKTRFILGVILSLPILILSMLGEHLGLPTKLNLWSQFLLATPVMLWAGSIFFHRAWNSLLKGHLNMFTLISIGTGTAYIYSIIALFFPELFPEKYKAKGHVELYFEAAAVIITLVLLGQMIEAKARSRTSNAIKELLGQAPKTARVLDKNGNETEKPISSVEKGDHIKVPPGTKVPVDGVILEGSGILDESMITGEPIPTSKHPGDKVTGATINTQGSFIMKAERVGKDTLLSQIVDLVSQAQRSRAPIEKLADTVSSYFVPAVILVAILTIIIWSIWGPEPKLVYGLVNAVAVLIIACPCAVGLATPMSIMVGIGKGAQSGILIKNAEALQTFAKIDTLLVDKTGTLTEGKPTVEQIQVTNNFAQNEVLQLAASLENASEHPLSQAIVKYAKSQSLDLYKSTNFHSETGKGIKGTVNNKEILIGNGTFLKDHNIEVSSKNNDIAKTVIYIAIDNKYAGSLTISDPIKKTTPSAIKNLKAMGIKVIMLTGDNKSVAEKVSKELNLDSFHANVSPTDKHSYVAKYQKQGKHVAMAGDGINDAAALAQADIGIAMGTGTDVAIESADITLVKGDIRAITSAIELSRLTMRNIKQNLVFAFIYNAVGVPIAAGLLYPFTGLLLSPILASIAMSLSSISVIGNALRLKKSKPG